MLLKQPIPAQSPWRRLGWALIPLAIAATVTFGLLSKSVDHHTPADTHITGVVIANDVDVSCPIVDGMGAVLSDEGACAAAVVEVTSSSDPVRIAVGSNRTVTDGSPWVDGAAYTGRVPYPNSSAYFQFGAGLCFCVALLLFVILITSSSRRGSGPSSPAPRPLEERP